MTLFCSFSLNKHKKRCNYDGRYFKARGWRLEAHLGRKILKKCGVRGPWVGKESQPGPARAVAVSGWARHWGRNYGWETREWGSDWDHNQHHHHLHIHQLPGRLVWTPVWLSSLTAALCSANWKGLITGPEITIYKKCGSALLCLGPVL